MPVSASPWGNLLSQQIKSPESFTADRQAVEAGGITNALNAAKLGEYQQGLQRSEQLRNLLSSGAGSDQLVKGGFLKEGMDLAKNNADVGNINAEETGRRVESFAKKAAIMRSSIGSVPTPQAAARYMQQAFADPDMGPVMKQFGTLEDALSEIPSNPNDFRNWQMQASEGIGKLVDHAEEQRTQAENERNNKAQRGIAARNASTAEGQLVVARGGLGLRQREFAYKEGKDSQDRNDKLSGVGGSSQASEGERKAATLLTRLRGSKAQLDSVLERDIGAAKPGVVAEFARGIPFVGGDTAANLATGESRQQVEAAQLDMLDAALTLGTGAAYTKEQLRGYARSYFPQIGDDKRTVADKAQRLKTVIEAAEIAAGRADPKRGRTSNGGASGEWGGGWSIQEVK